MAVSLVAPANNEGSFALDRFAINEETLPIWTSLFYLASQDFRSVFVCEERVSVCVCVVVCEGSEKLIAIYDPNLDLTIFLLISEEEKENEFYI